MKSGGVPVVLPSVLAVLTFLAGACSSDPASGGGSAGAGGSEICPDDLECPAEKTCQHANCAMEMDAIESATGPCAALVACEAECHCDVGCKGACETNLPTDCQTAYANAVACTHEKCEAEGCPESEGDDEGGESAEGGHAEVGGGGGATGGHAGAGGSSPASGPYSCYLPSGFQCTQVADAPATSIASGMVSCAMGGGVSGTMCPTDNVYGCCVDQGNANCEYNGVDWTAGGALSPPTDCAKGGGTWVSSPPEQ